MLTVQAVRQKGSKNFSATYQVQVSVNGKSIWRGIVFDHDRSTGWPQLLRQIADEKERE